MGRKLKYPDVLQRVNPETGEILSQEPIAEGETYLIQDKKRELTPQQIRYLNETEEMKQFNNEMGGFIFMYYNKLLYDKELDLDMGNVSRVIYLATYIDYNNILVLNSGYASGKKIKQMSKKYIKSVMNLSDRVFSNFFKEVTEKNILIKNEDGTFKMNDKYFVKGTTNYKDNFTRAYINTIRDLYLDTASRYHKCLTYIYKLLPMVDRQTNLIVHNPNNEYEEPKKMTLKDIGEFLGISTEKKNLDKFVKNNLFKIFIIKDGRKYWVFNQIVVKNGGGSKDYFAVNPMLYYGGNQYEHIPPIIKQLLVD